MGADVSNMTEEMSTLKSELSGASTSISSHEKSIVSYKEKIELLSKENENLAEKLKKSMNQVQALKSSVETGREQFVAEKNSLYKKIKCLSQENADMSQNLSKLCSLEDEIARLRGELDEKSDFLIRDKTRMAELEKINSDLYDEINDLKDAVDASKMSNETLQEKLTDIETAKTQMMDKHET